LSQKSFSAFAEKTFPLNLLSFTSRDLLSKMSAGGRDKISRFWLAIEDCLLASSSELYKNAQGLVFLRKLWKTLVGAAILNLKTAVKLWKEFTTWAKAVCLRYVGDTRQIPRLPFLRKLKQSLPFWWFTDAVQNGITSKEEMTKLAHLTSTRGLPCPDSFAIRESEEKWLNTLTSEIPDEGTFSDSDMEFLGRCLASRFPGDKAKAVEAARKSYHVSLSNTGTLAFSREQGGRASEISTLFKSFLSRTDIEYVGFDLFGRPVRVYPQAEVGVQLYTDDFEGVGSTSVDDTSCLVVIPAGVGNHTASQILFMAAFAAREEGYISFENNDMRRIKVEKPIPIRSLAVGEPGFKARIVSTGPWWLTTLLQPFGHGVVRLLSEYPMAKAGLTASYQGFEYAKGICGKDPDAWSDLVFVKTTDLETATDYLSHRKGRKLYHSFLSHVGLYGSYERFCVDLLTSPRAISSLGGRELNLPSPVTQRGSLMGEPGTKGLLTLTSMAAEEYGWRQYNLGIHAWKAILPSDAPKWRCAACAGDDLSAVGPITYLNGIRQGHIKQGCVVSLEKDGISKVGAFFCEEPLFIHGINPFRGTPHALFQEYEKHIHVDAVKMRLVSIEAKLTETRDESNPVFGKAAALQRKLEWLPDSLAWMEGWFVDRFVYRFSRYLNRDPRERLPLFLGGLGLWPSRIDDQISVIKSLSPLHLNAVRQFLERRASPALIRTLNKVCMNKYSRGIEIQEKLSIVSAFADEVDMFLGPDNGSTLSSEAVVGLLPPAPRERHQFWLKRVETRLNLITDVELEKRMQSFDRTVNLLLQRENPKGDFQTVKLSDRFAALEHDLGVLYATGNSYEPDHEDFVSVCGFMIGESVSSLQREPEFRVRRFINTTYPFWSVGSLWGGVYLFTDKSEFLAGIET